MTQKSLALALTSDETMLVESVNEMLDRSAPVDAFRALRDEDGDTRFRRALWQEMAEMGLPAIADPTQEHGTFGLSGAALVLEAVGRHLAASPLASALISADLLTSAGRADLVGLDEGKRVIAVALADRVLDADTGNGLTLIESGIIEGTVQLVPDGRQADLVLVLVIGEGGTALVALDPALPGVTRSPVDLVDHRDYCTLTCERVPIREHVTLARGEVARDLVARARDIGALFAAAELLGIARECYDRTIEYLKTREQFGVMIGSFQALQHRAARLYIDIELATGVVRKAMRAADAAAADSSQLASHAKLRLGLTAGKVVDEAVQMHGGIGVTDELDIGLFMKRARVLGELYGDHHAHRERLASERFHLPRP